MTSLGHSESNNVYNNVLTGHKKLDVMTDPIWNGYMCLIFTYVIVIYVTNILEI